LSAETTIRFWPEIGRSQLAEVLPVAASLCEA
jgi:hypothetical protein